MRFFLTEQRRTILSRELMEFGMSADVAKAWTELPDCCHAVDRTMAEVAAMAARVADSIQEQKRDHNQAEKIAFGLASVAILDSYRGAAVAKGLSARNCFPLWLRAVLTIAPIKGAVQ
jgi:hypothetical protein